MDDRPPRSASALPGKVVVDDHVRDVLERRCQSFRYANGNHPPTQMSGTLPARPRDRSEPPPRRRGMSVRSTGTTESYEPMPAPSLMQPQMYDPGRRIEMSSIATQEDSRASVRRRQEPTEFYRSSRNKFKSLPVTTKSKKSQKDSKPNFVVATFRWIRKNLFGTRSKTVVISRSGSQTRMDRPSHSRSLSLPRNTRFNRKKSSRAEPPPRVPASRSSEFPSVQHNYPSLRRGGSATQIFATGKSTPEASEEDFSMTPLLKGFPNLGNSCYWNAVLQALGALEPIAGHYLSSPYKRVKNNELTYTEEFTLVFKKLIEAMWKNQDGAEFIKRMRSIYENQQSIFGHPFEQDAHEFLIALVRMLASNAANVDCFTNEGNELGLDNGLFVDQFGALTHGTLSCSTCGYKAPNKVEFHPFVCIAFPPNSSFLIRFSVVRKLTKFGRVYRHALYLNSKTEFCMISAVKLLAHQTGIIDKRLLMFQVTSRGFAQSLITEHDLRRNRQPDDVLYVTELEGESLVNGYENVTIIFFHALNEPGQMRRVSEPFTCKLGLNAPYIDIATSVIKASGELVRPPRNLMNMVSSFDILLHDDNEMEPRVLNPLAKTPLMAAHATRCMDDQTRMFPTLPRFLRLVVRWKLPNLCLWPQVDHIVSDASYYDYIGYEQNSLTALFAKFFSPEYLDDWKCVRCNTMGGVRHTWYKVPPKIIACSLKRLVTDRSNNIHKIESPCSIPKQHFDMRRWTGGESGPDTDDRNRDDLMYDTVSFMCHVGDPLRNGHYLAYSRSPVSDNWHKYDDSNVYRIHESEVDTSNAYVIFLQNTKDRLSRHQQRECRDSGFFNSLRSRKNKEREPLNMLPNGPLITPPEKSLTRNGNSFRSDTSRRRPSNSTRGDGGSEISDMNTLRPPSQTNGVTLDRRGKNRASKETRI